MKQTALLKGMHCKPGARVFTTHERVMESHNAKHDAKHAREDSEASSPVMIGSNHRFARAFKELLLSSVFWTSGMINA